MIGAEESPTLPGFIVLNIGSVMDSQAAFANRATYHAIIAPQSCQVKRSRRVTLEPSTAAQGGQSPPTQEIIKQIVKFRGDSLSPRSHIPPCPPFANTLHIS